MQTQFRNIPIGASFDWIDPAPGARNSFFARCRKIGARLYVDAFGARYRVGSISAPAFNVDA